MVSRNSGPRVAIVTGHVPRVPNRPPRPRVQRRRRPRALRLTGRASLPLAALGAEVMLALAVPAFLAGALAGPSFVAVSRLSAARPFAPLVRGSVERLCVLAGSGVAAVSISAQFIFALFWLSPPLAGV